MRKFLLIFIFMHLYCVDLAQTTTTITEAEKAALDSMLKDDEFMNMLQTALNPKSYFVVSAGLGNSYFSTKNKQVNASQLEAQLVITPALAYFHKSGLAINTTAYISTFDGKTDFYQFGLSPSYSITKNKKIGATVSYTHTFVREGFQRVASPIKNELYGNIFLKKYWLKPGISLGLSGGHYTDYYKLDTVINGNHRIFIDTADIRLRIFSANIFVKHDFEFYKLLSKKDGMSVTPQLILNAGSQKFSITHNNLLFTRLKNLNSARFKNLGKRTDKTSFGLQSLAFNLDINYIIGKFGFEPQVYLDYYLPETTDDRFTSVFSFVVSYAF